MGKTYRQEKSMNNFGKTKQGSQKREKQQLTRMVQDMKRSNGNRHYLERYEKEFQDD